MAPSNLPEIILAAALVLSLTIIIASLAVESIKSWSGWSKNQPENNPFIPSGEVNLVYDKDGHCIRLVQDGAECILDKGKGESKKTVSVKDRNLVLNPHFFHTADQVKISFATSLICGVCDTKEYVRNTAQTEKDIDVIVQTVVIPALAHAIAEIKRENILTDLEVINYKAQQEANNWLSRYGLIMHMIAITPLDIPSAPASSKPEGQREADMLSALNQVVPTMDEKTLIHRRRMFELEMLNKR